MKLKGLKLLKVEAVNIKIDVELSEVKTSIGRKYNKMKIPNVNYSND